MTIDYVSEIEILLYYFVYANLYFIYYIFIIYIYFLIVKVSENVL